MRPATLDLTDRESHFDFGKNWAEYSALIDEKRLNAATQSLRRLVPGIAGKSFLDIGSGSGLFSAAALRLGAERVHAVDIDEDSVATTRRVLARYCGRERWTAERESVFDLSPESLGHFDVVYSWGVLHHTGDMWRAINCAAEMVAPGGVFAFALYEKTPLCAAWKLEKQAYAQATPKIQKLARETYKILFGFARFTSGRGFPKKDMQRGMDFEHNVHDWLGGHPYQSTERNEVFEHMRLLGFGRVLEEPVKVHAAGLFGTGCSEYVYRRNNR